MVIVVLGLLPIIIAADTPIPPVPEELPGWMIYHVMKWKALVDRWHLEFPNVPKALVYSVIAKESQGFPYLVSEDGHGSVGLMQIIPRTWTNTAQKLKNPNINIYVGTWMLSVIMERKNGDMRETLAVYNCGDQGVEQDKCGTYGGYVYADDVLENYYPVFRSIIIKDRRLDLDMIRRVQHRYYQKYLYDKRLR